MLDILYPYKYIVLKVEIVATQNETVCLFKVICSVVIHYNLIITTVITSRVFGRVESKRERER